MELGKIEKDLKKQRRDLERKVRKHKRDVVEKIEKQDQTQSDFKDKEIKRAQRDEERLSYEK